jgi:hypothetical protein
MLSEGLHVGKCTMPATCTVKTLERHSPPGSMRQLLQASISVVVSAKVTQAELGLTTGRLVPTATTQQG